MLLTFVFINGHGASPCGFFGSGELSPVLAETMLRPQGK
jgi:hypothetical protein